MNDEIESARHALSKRKIIERAKGELMDKQKLNEEDAYRLMQQKAMEGGAKLIDVARLILERAQTDSQSSVHSG
jgi:AmiR/NasT family two-component response regulator